MIKTKIIATLGPACSQSEIISAFIDNGVDVFRVNFSHGTPEEHSEGLEVINAVRSSHRHTTAVMGDLCGPKIRTATLEPTGRVLSVGEVVTVVRGSEPGTATRFGTNYKHFVDDVQVGHRIFIDDGQIELRVMDRSHNDVICEVVAGGLLGSHKGINLPDTRVRIASITDDDWKCVDWAIEHDLDFLALSFVRGAHDVVSLKEYIRDAGAEIEVVAKIETPQAVGDLERIVDASDAVLVARGDLGVEMDLAQVPLLQKRITGICRDRGKPVIVATQMLQSMIGSPVPTRAEVSDVANAIMDVTDAMMLSGETAIGSFPLQAVKAIRRTAAVTEEYQDRNYSIPPSSAAPPELALTATIAHSVAQIVDDIGASLVVVWSQSGATARLLSKTRIDVPILVFSSDARTCRQMCLHYGVIPRCRQIPADFEHFVRMVVTLILERKWASAGDKIVLVAGQPIGTAGATNALLVHTIGK